MMLISLFSSCSSAQKLVTNPPMTLGDVYFQKWIAGIKDGGSGMDLYIPITGDLPNNIQLDSVYFSGKVIKLQKLESSNELYVGRFKSNLNPKPDVVMSSEMNEEYGNKVLKLENKIPFELKNSECVVSYREDEKTKYFKIEGIIEKPSQNYPGRPLEKHE